MGKERLSLQLVQGRPTTLTSVLAGSGPGALIFQQEKVGAVDVHWTLWAVPVRAERHFVLCGVWWSRRSGRDRIFWTFHHTQKRESTEYRSWWKEIIIYRFERIKMLLIDLTS